MEYVIKTHYDEVLLAQIVLKQIFDGWLPQGGVSVAISPGGGYCYAQAMIRERSKVA